MNTRYIILLYLIIIIAVIVYSPTVSISQPDRTDSITQYLIDLSHEISRSIEPEEALLSDSRGELRLKLLLSPWGELKDAYVSESSGNRELDTLCLNAVWRYKRYRPFPEALGEDERWVEVPIIFKAGREGSGLGAQGSGIETENARIEHYPVRIDEYSNGLPLKGMDEAVDIALENHLAAKIAREEVQLSKLKIREARRALYPSTSLNYLETMGKTTGTTQSFTDKEYKLKFEYPLYYGWRLRYAVEQAVSNMKASRQSYDKVLQDLRLDVEIAFYSYLTNKVNVGLQKELLQEAERILKTAEKRFKLGLSTEAEFLQVKSQFKQIAYQVTSSQNDLDMAKLSLAQAMNIENPDKLKDLLDIDIDIMNLKPATMDIDLNECLDLAFKYRPDLKEKEYLVEFNEYERKIAETKNQLKVDLTGSYGRSGGAYESEPLTLDTDWYLGVKITKPLGGNTLSTAYTQEKTSEKHGQTSRTEATSKSIELGLLDNLQSFSERKSAEIALNKARQELQKVRDGIYKEVKEAYLDYKKGLIQTSANLNKIRYREEELKIAKARAELNEIPLSGLLQAYMSLTDEKSFYIESIGSLYQSLAKLNKATGYALFLENGNFMLAHTGK